MTTETPGHARNGGAAPNHGSPRDGARSRAGDEDVFSPEVQVHEPHRVGLPPIGPYVRELWRRRQFALELSRTDLRAQHFNTAFGQLWLLINPLLLACVYFVLVDILRRGSRGSEFFAHLMASLFAYYFVQQSMTQGVKSVVSGGRLILNTAFPRALLPLSSVVTAFTRFVPTLLIYAPVHIISGLPIAPVLLWTVPIVALLVLLAAGLTMFVAAAQVYFRDLSSFLPYILRIWLYATPILYYAAEVPERYRAILAVNPLAPILSALSQVVNEGRAPAAGDMLLGLAWALALFAAGAVFFLSREREFAVRL